MVEDSKGAKPQVATRLPHDTHDELEEYCEEREITKSDALRRFVDDGLARDRDEDDRLADTMAAPDVRPFELLTFAIVVAIALRVFGVA